MKLARATKLAKDTVNRLHPGDVWPLGHSTVMMPLDGSNTITVVDGNKVAAAGLSKDEAVNRLIENLMTKRR